MPQAADPPLYERDFYLWTQDQAARLRAMARDNDLDAENLAEEVEALGRSERTAVERNLVQVVAHLLEHAWIDAPDPHTHWRREIVAHQQAAQDSFTPGMRQHLDMARIWRRAYHLANAKFADHSEASLPRHTECPFTLDEFLRTDFDIEEARTRLHRALGRDTDGA